MSTRLIIFGTGELAEVAEFYFQRDSSYEVVAFTATADAVGAREFHGKPLVAFETLATTHPPGDHELFIAVGYSKMNRLRADFFTAAKTMGYRCATYLSSRATHWGDTTIGENCFILEDNTLQPFVTIGDDVVLWSGNHVGHHSTIGSHCFVTSYVVISGYCRIGAYSFIGVNATITENTAVGERNLIGPSSLIQKDTGPDEAYIAERTKKFPKDSSRFMT